MIGSKLAPALMRHRSKAFAIAAAIKDAIQIVVTVHMLAPQIIRQRCGNALSVHPSFIALAQIDEQARLFVSKRADAGHGTFIPQLCQICQYVGLFPLIREDPISAR